MFKTSVISRIFGRFASLKFPSPIQYIVNKSYVYLMEVDMSEFEKISYYKSLNALFTRKLMHKREVDEDKNIFISPCDGYITECGDMENTLALQIKGFIYSVYDLIGDKINTGDKEKITDGKYINFYLSPKDYHRYHAPVDMKINKAVHIPGKLYPVNIKYLQKIPSLFIENERVVLECETLDKKLFYMVFVGALNVGKMSFVFDDRIQTNSDKRDITHYDYNGIILKKAQELGKFEMGSTIVMFFQKDSIEFTCRAGKNIKFGEKIARKI